MYLKTTKKRYKGKTIEHAKIVESYRDGKTSRQKVILNLGAVNSEEDRKKFRKILEAMRKEGESFVKKSEIVIKSSKEYGVTHTVNMLLEKYRIKEILQRELLKNKVRKFNVYGVIKALIINRLVRPSSDLSAHDWICNDYVEKLDVKEHQVYRALDYLIQRKNEIEKGIFENLKETLKLNIDFVHYDLTSTYFEGCCCVIATYGHSRDHRKDRKQIVVGLVMCDGIPIYHEVHKGNTVDKTTLKGMIKNLKRKFGIKKVIVVADRGIITEDNLDLLENEEYQYILGTQRRNNNLSEDLLVKRISSKKTQFAKEVRKEEFEKNGKKHVRRYVLCLDSKTRKERLVTLKVIKKKVEKKLEDLQKRYKKSKESKKGKKITKESLIQQTYKILGRNKRLFKIEFDNGLKFSLNKRKYKYEKKIAGKFLLVTNTDRNAGEIMKSYKELQMVERAIDEIKNFLEVRPIGHRKKRRVKAHTLVCVLSFLIESIIERFSSETARKTLQKLKRIHVIEIELGKEKIIKFTEISSEMKKIFKNLKIQDPVSYEVLNKM